MVDEFLFFGNWGIMLFCLEGPWDCDCGPAFWMFLVGFSFFVTNSPTQQALDYE